MVASLFPPSNIVIVLICALLALTPACKPSGKDKEQGEKSSSKSTQADATAGGVSNENSGEDDEEDEEESVPVEVVQITEDDIAETLYATATVQSQHQVVILSEAAGRLVKLDPQEGDTIPKAQAVVGRIENAELALAVESARAQVERVRAELKRLEPLLEKGYIPRADYDRTKTELDIAERELKRTQTVASKERIRSPIAGVVATRHVEIGTQVLPNQPILTVLDPDALEVRIQVPERELGRLEVGQPAKVHSEALGEHRFPGQVGAIAPTVDPTSGTVGVTVTVKDPYTPDKKRKLRPGMFVAVYIEIELRESAALAPKRALVYEEGTPHLFVVRNERAELVSIKTGASEGDRVELREGPRVSEEVIVLGQANLKHKARVRVVRRNGKAVVTQPAKDP